MELGWSQTRAYSLLAEGENILWHRVQLPSHWPSGAERYGTGPRSRGLHLHSAKAIATTWGIEHLSPAPVDIPLELAKPPKARAMTGVHTWNAMLYASQMPGERPPKIIPRRESGAAPIVVTEHNRPESRASISRRTGISKPTQIAYERVRLRDRKIVTKRPNVAVFQDGRPQMALVVREGRNGRRILLPRRLPNSYTCRFSRHGCGQAIAFNGLQARSAKGPSLTTGHGKRYFRNAVSYVKASQKGKPIDDEPFIWQPPNQNRGRTLRYATLWTSAHGQDPFERPIHTYEK